MSFRIFIPVLLLTLWASCKKNSPGSVEYKIRFTTEDPVYKTERIAADSFYTQFGPYILSLTPHQFIAHIWSIGYIDNVLNPANNSANMLQYIEQNGEKLPMGDPSRFVDFTSDTIRTFDPVLYGQMRDGVFEAEQIQFKYFYFLPFGYQLQAILPAEYAGVQFNNLMGGSVSDSLITLNQWILGRLYPNANIQNGMYITFGNADSTWVVNPNGEQVLLSDDCPIVHNPGTVLCIRSHKYSNMIFNRPPHGELVEMYGVINFDLDNLLQVYAGADNQPYTSDDIFIFAPNFWERVSARLEVN